MLPSIRRIVVEGGKESMPSLIRQLTTPEREPKTFFITKTQWRIIEASTRSVKILGHLDYIIYSGI
ncbi:protein of unknown function [Nitrospira japonica]|uniref:Uncharacterized protein n=1 Tax=Nitrospira japonica TaxID=1325564 RepID=A0A1W1I545_9BACT|nr:protein of unknown function [Nitrospira japonica]